MLKQVDLISLGQVLFLCFHVPVNELNGQSTRQLLVKHFLHELAVLARDSLLPCVVRLGQVQTNQREGVLLKETAEVSPG